VHHASVTLPPPVTSSKIAPTTPPDACKRVTEQQSAKARAAVDEAKRHSPDDWAPKVEDGVTDAIATMGIACHGFPAGAWSIEPSSLELYPQWSSASAQLVAVLYLHDQRYESTDFLHGGYGAMFTHVDSVLASDYDHDGIPEVWIHASVEGPEGGHSEQSKLLGFTNGKVVPYAKADPDKLGIIEEPRDVDGDGILDLPVSWGIELGQGVECIGQSDWSSPAFVAHALSDGTFSVDDAVARAFVKSWCPSPPSKIASPANALCARMWKMPRTAVTSSCVVWDCDLERSSKPQPKGATRDCEDRVNAYDATVPFTLP
jgi:hypothetical protein